MWGIAVSYNIVSLFFFGVSAKKRGDKKDFFRASSSINLSAPLLFLRMILIRKNISLDAINRFPNQGYYYSDLVGNCSTCLPICYFFSYFLGGEAKEYTCRLQYF